MCSPFQFAFVHPAYYTTFSSNDFSNSALPLCEPFFSVYVIKLMFQFCSVYVFPCVGFRPHSFNITRTTTRKSWRKKQIPMFLESWTLNFCAMGFGLRLWSERKRFNVLYLSRSELVLFILTFFFYLIPKLRKHSLKMYLFFYHFAVRVDTKSAYDINYIDGYGVVVADAYTK